MEPIIRLARPEDYRQVEGMMQQIQQLHVDWRPDIYQPCAVVMSEVVFLEFEIRLLMLF